MKKLFLLLLLLTNLNSATKIIETDDITEVEKYTQNSSETLYIFDLDNTVVCPADYLEGLGGDCWFTALIKKCGNNVGDAVSRYVRLQQYVDLTFVESRTVGTIKKLQEKGLKVIALTNRSKPLLQRTIDELNKIGVNFQKSGVCGFSLKRFIKEDWFYREGITFCGQNSKGLVLKELLREMNIKPKKIVFIDDKQKYLDQVGSVFGEFTDFVGIRYSRMDNFAKTFSFDKANQVMANMGIKGILPEA